MESSQRQPHGRTISSIEAMRHQRQHPDQRAGWTPARRSGPSATADPRNLAVYVLAFLAHPTLAMAPPQSRPLGKNPN
eukprot:6947799-Pyramimonas_sp.AAC.1